MARYSRIWRDPTLPRVAIGFGPWAALTINTRSTSRSGFVQRPRSPSPNPYSSVRTEVPNPPVGRYNADSSALALYTSPGQRLSTLSIAANNRAYNKFVSNVHNGKNASLALTAIDYKNSALMIAKRGGQILAAVRAARRFDIPALARALGVQPKKEHRRRKDQRAVKHTGKRPSDLWLEYNFGWAPLVDDIYTASQVLGKTIPATTVRGRGSNNFRENVVVNNGFVGTQFFEIVVRCLLQSRVRITNPNLLLLNQLGLVNPAHVAWDAVPFSFVADWFIPVGRFLKSWTDFVGIELIDPFTTIYWRGLETGKDTTVAVYRNVAWMHRVERSLGTPKFRFPPFFQFQPDIWKAVTSAALIIQKVTPALKSLR